MVGTWDVNVTVGGMPEKLATAFAEFANSIVGSDYTPIAYLGSQIVNGINHAVLAEQLLTTGKDTKNVVLIIFNEKEDKFTVVNIERVVEGGEEFGGANVDVKTDIPAEAFAAFNKVLGSFVGADVNPFALLATQITRGTDYIFAATVSPVIDGKTVDNVAVVTVNELNNVASFCDILKSDLEVSLGKPLGEWP